MKIVHFKITGMHCASCKMLIEDALQEIGVKSTIDPKKGTAVIEFDERKVTFSKIKNAIEKEGEYKVVEE